MLRSGNSGQQTSQKSAEKDGEIFDAEGSCQTSPVFPSS